MLTWEPFQPDGGEWVTRSGKESFGWWKVQMLMVISITRAHYDIAGNEWVLVGPLPDSPVYRTAAVSLDGVIYHVGGYTGGFYSTGLSHKLFDIDCRPVNSPSKPQNSH